MESRTCIALLKDLETFEFGLYIHRAPSGAEETIELSSNYA